MAPIALFLQSDSYEMLHQALSIAASGAAAGRRVEVFLSWWALDRLLRDDLDGPDFGPGREAITEAFEERGFPTLRQLLAHARATGLVRLTACSGSLALLGRTTRDLEGKVDEIAGWAAILERTQGIVDRFFG